MAPIKIKKGLDIPLLGAPIKELGDLSSSSKIYFDFTPYFSIKPHLLVKIGDKVLKGEPLVSDKKDPSRVWISPSSGEIKQINRGEKRVLESIEISPDGNDLEFGHPLLKTNPSKEDLIKYLSETGLLPLIFMRPFHLPAHPNLLPRSIYVKGIESAPFTPPASMQVKGNEQYFQKGLDLLSILSEVHLVYRSGDEVFCTMKNAHLHPAEGPHPVANLSLHIQRIDPIKKLTDVVWTIDAWSVVAIGKRAIDNKTHTDKVISIAGAGILEEHRGYYHAKIGYPLEEISKEKTLKEEVRLISGDPLMGRKSPFLGLFHSGVTAILESAPRKPLHFFRLGFNVFTATRAYLSSFLPQKKYPFTTQLHGEVRPFIDANIYNSVMPLDIPLVPLIKAVLAEDFDLSIKLGLLEVAPEDFALPTFICPSKIEMVEIIEKGLQQCASENLSL